MASSRCALCLRRKEDLSFGSLLDVDDLEISHLTRNIISLVGGPCQLCAKCCRELALVGQLLFKWKERIDVKLERAAERLFVKKEEPIDDDYCRSFGEEETTTVRKAETTGRKAETTGRKAETTNWNAEKEAPEEKEGFRASTPGVEEEDDPRPRADGGGGGGGPISSGGGSEVPEDDGAAPNGDGRDSDDASDYEDVLAEGNGDEDDSDSDYGPAKQTRKKKTSKKREERSGRRFLKRSEAKREKASKTKEAKTKEAKTSPPNPELAQHLDDLLRSEEEKEKREKESFACPECRKVFKLKPCFDRHVAAHSAVHGCHVCGKVLPKKDALKRHLATHGDRIEYKCDQCGKIYHTRNSLNMHEYIHHRGGERRHLCRYCPQKFWQRGDLVGHERIHTKEKPFQCRYCDNKFRTSFIRKQHEATHTDRVPKWPCGICGNVYLRRSYRDDHVKIQHAPPKVPCPYHCGKMFRRKQKSKEHGKICPLSCDVNEAFPEYI